jgi:hypothetical protein
MSKWRRGHVGRFWYTEEVKNLNYTKQPITQDEVDQWVSKGYDYVKSFTGSMYDNKNPMPEFINRLKDIFYNYKNLTFTFYKMSTLEIMPEHSDHYNTYMKLYGADYKNVHRILLMLEDWKPGHYLEIDGTGIINWVAGDYFIWENDCKHAAANIGVEDRYTLQITAEILSDNSTDYKLHWYNIPDRESKTESSQYYMNRVLNGVTDNIRNEPLYIYMLNQQIVELETIIHDQSTVPYLNEKGITFYLTEPLCGYTRLPRKHTLSIYSEFKGDEDSSALRADELDSIKEYVIRNKLTNVNVYTCDYDAKTYYPYYKSFMNIETDDLFIRTIPQKTVFHTNVKAAFNKKFICLNWRFTPHRQLLAAYLSQKSSTISWYFRGDLPVVGHYNWISIFSLRDPKYFNTLIDGITYLNANAPLSVDLPDVESISLYDTAHGEFIPNSQILNNSSNEIIENAYLNVFCDIVTESRFAQPTGNFSEKVFHPIWYKKPFVLAAPPHTLKYLKEEGYKTFNEFWDESYDDCENHEERLMKIFDVIDFIDSKSIDELREMYEQMKPILKHNYDLIKQKLPTVEK